MKVTFYGADAKNWLQKFLSSGPENISIVKTVARSEGFTKGELNRARKLLGVKTIQPSPNTWLWSLPKNSKRL